MSKKPVITFEGIEGSGKSYHISRVAKYLKKRKLDFIKIREPGGNLNSEKIRKLILNKKSKIQDLLTFYMGKNTPDRQEFIIDKLRVEKDLIET